MQTDGQKDGRVHFRSTGRTLGGLGVVWPIPRYPWHSELNFPKFVHKHTEKKVTPKDPLRLNARDLKIQSSADRFMK